MGVKVKTVFVALAVTVPAMAAPPVALTRKSVVLRVSGFMACGKVAAMTLLGQMAPEPFAGVMEVGKGAGAQGLVPVVKLQV